MITSDESIEESMSLAERLCYESRMSAFVVRATTLAHYNLSDFKGHW